MACRVRLREHAEKLRPCVVIELKDRCPAHSSEMEREAQVLGVNQDFASILIVSDREAPWAHFARELIVDCCTTRRRVEAMTPPRLAAPPPVLGQVV